MNKRRVLAALMVSILATHAYANNTSTNLVASSSLPVSQVQAQLLSLTNSNVINTTDNTTVASDAFDDPFAMDVDANTASVSDPLEPYNRFMFKMNTGLDNRFAKPVAKGYKRITPKPIRSGVGNFFNNLSEPWNAVNLLLQGKPASSVKSLGRFTVNTVTTLGFGDPAVSALDLTTTKEDFGQTLGVWGVPSGPYLVLPVLGPSTLRDSSARAVDATGNPFTYIDSAAASASAGMVYSIDKRAQLLTFEGLVNANDYELVRDIYLQKRAFDINESGSLSDQAAEQNSDDRFDQGFGD